MPHLLRTVLGYDLAAAYRACFAGYAVLFAAVHLLFFPGFPPAFLLIYAPLASLLAVVAERRSPIWLDDDLAMQIAPLVVLVPLDLALGAGSLQIP